MPSEPSDSGPVTTPTERPYEQRQAAAGPLQADLWAAVKAARDDAFNRMLSAQSEYEAMDALLKRMKAAGMADHLATLDEVQAAWRRMTEVETANAR